MRPFIPGRLHWFIASALWCVLPTINLLSICGVLILGGCAPKAGHNLQTTIPNATPRERDMLAKLNLQGAELVRAQIDLDNARAKIANEQGEAQAAIDRANSAEGARQTLAAKDAGIRRAILWLLGIVAGFAVLAGGILGWITKSALIGGSLAAGGILLLLVVVNAGDAWVTLIVRVGIGGTMALLLASAAVWLWGRVHEQHTLDDKTNLQAERKREMAAVAVDAGDDIAAGVLIAEAGILERVAKSDYSPDIVQPGTQAVNLLTASDGNNP